MSRKRYCHLMMELARRLSVKYGAQSPLGEILKHYRQREFGSEVQKSKRGYKDLWNSDGIITARKMVEML